MNTLQLCSCVHMFLRPSHMIGKGNDSDGEVTSCWNEHVPLSESSGSIYTVNLQY